MTNFLRNKVFYAIVAAVIIAGYLVFYGGNETRIKYVTQKVERGELTSFVSASATLKPTKEARIYPEIEGTIKEIRFDVNAEVKKGQILALIEAPEGLSGDIEYSRQILKKAETDLEISSNSHAASEKLYEKDLISLEEFNRSLSEHRMTVAAWEKAKADLKIAEGNLKATQITSILNGVVLEKNIIIGERVRPNKAKPLYVLAENPRTLHLVSNISEADIGKIRKGQQVVFTVDAFPGKSFNAKVTEIANSARIKNDIVTYDVTCVAENPKFKLKSGMTAEAKIIISVKEDVLKIPTAALRFIPPEESQTIETETVTGGIVWTLSKENLAPVEIKTGISDDFYTEIIDGPLSEKDQVVVEYILSGKEGKGTGFALPQPKRF